MLHNLTDKQKVNWVRITAMLAVLVLMLYAPKLWISTKVFPVIPLFDWLPIPTNPVDYILAGFFFLIQIVYIFQNKRWQGWLVLLLYLYLALVDQNRLQPYFYQSFLTILVIEIFPRKTDYRKILYAVILIFFATYFWSGIQKLNEAFYIQWLTALNKHFSFLPQWFLVAFTYVVPWLEALMGVCLLFNTTRKFGVIFILGMHGIITFLLFYLGYGYNVVPWNIQNMISVPIIFWNLKTTNAFEFFTNFFSKQKVIALIFTLFLPLANNLTGFYDNLLSFHFFTADLNYYNVFISEELEEVLPEYIEGFYRFEKGKTYINMNEWAQHDNKVLFYPEERIINYMDTYLRSFAENPEKIGLTKLVVYNQDYKN
ncbi:MauE/DoxX family redox-associated membrane protein [uncultured Polaribacter sp.]|uniref:MauE/DoxX family redox-associated membrane protein n=1 Tax=uncultured Polaribacter sp. TaxID=174711 RepID=UPI0026062D13|nr:MauE/DoxX family redox-associated membrane protein [uncultured Polaribacter sp.]